MEKPETWREKKCCTLKCNKEIINNLGQVKRQSWRDKRQNYRPLNSEKCIKPFIS